jgi:hypothetical protein
MRSDIIVNKQLYVVQKGADGRAYMCVSYDNMKSLPTLSLFLLSSFFHSLFHTILSSCYAYFTEFYLTFESRYVRFQRVSCSALYRNYRKTMLEILLFFHYKRN